MGPTRASDSGAVDATPDPYRLFVGREREMDVSVRALQDVTSGRGRMLLLAGEPGIGKTRLADELAERWAKSGALVVWGRCWEAGGAPAFWPWTQSLRDLIRSLGDEELAASVGGAAAEVAQLVPDLKRRVRDVPELPPASGDAARFRLFEAVVEFLRQASRRRALALILDDLHAADAPSVLLLRFVADALTSSPILIVGTYRDTELTPDHPLFATLPNLLRVPGALRLTLSGLPEDDVAPLVRAVSGRAAPPRLVSAIHDGTEGNPLFVREVVELLVSEDRISDATDPSRWGVPQTVREVIGRRLRRLSDDGRRTLAVASVIGRDFSVDALHRVVGSSPEDVLESLRDAVSARVVAKVVGAPGRFRFSHSLVRDALYEDLGPGERARLHRAVGEALEALYGPDSEPHLAELAHHFFEAAAVGDTGKAIEYSRRAAERAVEVLAFEEAVRLFRMALQALERAPDEDTRCRLLLGLGDALARAGEGAGSRETFLEASEIATRLDDPELLAEAAVGYGGRFIFARAGRDRNLIPLLEHALAALGPEDSVLRVRVLARLSGALRDQPSMERRAALSQEAIEMARRLGHPDSLMRALIGRWGAVSLGADGLDEQRAIADELNRLADELGDMERAMDAVWFRFIHYRSIGELDRAREEQRSYSRLADELGQPPQRWYAAVMATILALQDGRFDEAEELIERAHELGREAQRWDAGASSLFARFILLRERGRLAELEDDRRRAFDEYPGYRSLRCMLILSLCELGRTDEATPMFERVAENHFARFPKDNEWLANLSLLTEVADILGDRRRAAILYDLLSPYSDQIALIASEVHLGPVETFLGILASLLGRYDDAQRHFETAVEMSRRMQARPLLARALYHHARMLRERGGSEDVATAVEALREAVEICDRTGMTALRDRIAEALTQLGTTPPAHETRARARDPSEALEQAPVGRDGEAIFRREGEYFEVSYEGETFRLRDSKGLRYVAQLLASPGREIHVLDLVAAVEGGSARAAGPAVRPDEATVGSSEAPLIDAAARDAYRARLRELQEDIDEAESFGDSERAARAREEMELLAQELSGATGLGGRARTTTSAAERARVNVTKAIKGALDRVREHSATLGRHLDVTVRTGTFCSYTPDPRAPLDWRL